MDEIEERLTKLWATSDRDTLLFALVCFQYDTVKELREANSLLRVVLKLAYGEKILESAERAESERKNKPLSGASVK